MILGIHHIGVVVKDLEQAVKSYEEALGLRRGETHHDPKRGIRAVMMPIGNCNFEFLEANDDRGIGKSFLEKHGEGINHICFEVDDVHNELDALVEKDIALQDRLPRQGITGTVAFLQDPMNGITIELVETKKAT
ncbi:VOC family protein [Chloroflexota bacterium]